MSRTEEIQYGIRYGDGDIDIAHSREEALRDMASIRERVASGKIEDDPPGTYEPMTLVRRKVVTLVQESEWYTDEQEVRRECPHGRISPASCVDCHLAWRDERARHPKAADNVCGGTDPAYPGYWCTLPKGHENHLIEECNHAAQAGTALGEEVRLAGRLVTGERNFPDFPGGGEDLAALLEDVRGHTMMMFAYTHPEDGRVCAFHQRLGKYVTSREDGFFECLRDHTVYVNEYHPFARNPWRPKRVWGILR